MITSDPTFPIVIDRRLDLRGLADLLDSDVMARERQRRRARQRPYVISYDRAGNRVVRPIYDYEDR